MLRTPEWLARAAKLRATPIACAIALLIPALLASLLTPPRATAQPAIDPRKPSADGSQVPSLNLSTDPALPYGTVGVVEGNVDGEGLKFTVGGLSILQPVVVTLFAGDRADDLKLTLFKNDWTTPRRSGSTHGAGSVDLTFRTEGGFNILVQSSGPVRPFALVALAGDEVRPALPSVIVPATGRPGSGATAGHTGGGAAATSTQLPACAQRQRRWPWILPLALAGAAAALLFVRSRSERRDDART